MRIIIIVYWPDRKFLEYYYTGKSVNSWYRKLIWSSYIKKGMDIRNYIGSYTNLFT